MEEYFKNNYFENKEYFKRKLMFDDPFHMD